MIWRPRRDRSKELHTGRPKTVVGISASHQQISEGIGILTTEVLRSIARKVESLPTLPNVAIKVIETALDENASAKDVADIVVTDQALAGKLLKVVNSPSMGLRHEVSDVSQAIVLLGFQVLKSLVLSISIFSESFTDNASRGLKKSHYWRHCLACAAAARALAVQKRYPNPEEAYIGGLLHDLGKVVLDQHLTEHYRKVLKQQEESEDPPVDVEFQLLRTDHAEVGGWVAQRWNLPRCIQRVVKYHHTFLDVEDLTSQERVLVALVSAADFICWTQGLGSVRAKRPPALSANVQEVIDFEKLDPTRAMNAVDEEMRNTAAIFKFEVPDVGSYREALQCANLELGRINALYHQVKRQLEGQVKIISSINEFIRTVHKGLRPDEVISAALQVARSHLGFDRAVYLSVNHDTKELISEKLLPDDGAFPAGSFKVPLGEDGGLSRCVYEQVTMTVTTRDERDHSVLELLGSSEVALAPLVANKETYGVIAVDNNLSGRVISDAFLHSLRMLAHEAGMALDNALLYEKTRQQASTDELTQVFNRRHILQALEVEVKKAQRHTRPLSVVMMDLDRFKGFNDNYGHQVGDSVLRQVGSLLGAATRSTDIVGRYGGEEFLLVLPETPVENGQIFAEKLRRLIESFGERLNASYPRCRLSASLGVAGIRPSDNLDSVVSRADQAMYKAKQEGRNKVSVLT